MSSNQVAAEEAAQAAAEAKWRATFRNIKLVVPSTLSPFKFGGFFNLTHKKLNLEQGT